MKIPSEYQKAIVEEFRYASKMMQEASYAEQKLFYYSSTYGVLSRIFNIHYDSHLVFAHFVLNHSYANLNARINAIKSGDQVIEFPPDFFNKLSALVSDFADKIDKGMETFEVLQRVAELSFISTGNGYYLMKKGLLKI